MNETELLALYRDNASLRKQLADAEIREMELKDRIEKCHAFISICNEELTSGEVDELTCLLNGE